MPVYWIFYVLKESILCRNDEVHGCVEDNLFLSSNLLLSTLRVSDQKCNRASLSTIICLSLSIGDLESHIFNCIALIF
jgi:hypothetical protein